MDDAVLIEILIVCGVMGWVLTWAMRRYALSRHIIDIPNDRSSHTLPTPRGGGVAFVIAFLCGSLWLMLEGGLQMASFSTVAVAGAWVALVGFMDDRSHIRAGWRLLAHILAAVWVLWMVVEIPELTVFGLVLQVQWLLAVLWVLFMAWMLNLYNFMDGIDGLAASQAVFVASAGALLFWVSGYGDSAGLPLLLAFSVAGFLVWNFPPAKIFMGDAGSGFLGMVLAVFTLHAAVIGMQFFWAWLILSGVFIVDATFTLLRRLARGGSFYQAHRTHAYQYASRRLGSHRIVTLSVWCINILWLLPIAWLVSTQTIPGEWGVLLAYAVLLMFAIYFQAGKAERESESAQ